MDWKKTGWTKTGWTKMNWTKNGSDTIYIYLINIYICIKMIRIIIIYIPGNKYSHGIFYLPLSQMNEITHSISIWNYARIYCQLNTNVGMFFIQIWYYTSKYILLLYFKVIIILYYLSALIMVPRDASLPVISYYFANINDCRISFKLFRLRTPVIIFSILMILFLFCSN